VLRALEARYGDQLEFRTVLIGLVETVEESLARGSSAEGRALTAPRFRRFGMPIAAHVRTRVIASGPACRFVKAATLQSAAAGEAALRLLRLAWYTTPLLLDTDGALAQVAACLDGLDAERALTDLHGEAVDAAYRADREAARSPSPVADTTATPDRVAAEQALTHLVAHRRVGVSRSVRAVRARRARPARLGRRSAHRIRGAHDPARLTRSSHRDERRLLRDPAACGVTPRRTPRVTAGRGR
jgi:hypothetical protein